MTLMVVIRPHDTVEVESTAIFSPKHCPVNTVPLHSNLFVVVQE